MVLNMAKAPTYKAGDFVVYPTHGVGEVTGVEKLEIAGQKLDLVIITFNRDRMTLRVPLDKAPTSGLRKLSSRKIMEDRILSSSRILEITE